MTPPRSLAVAAALVALVLGGPATPALAAAPSSPQAAAAPGDVAVIFKELAGGPDRTFVRTSARPGDVWLVCRAGDGDKPVQWRDGRFYTEWSGNAGMSFGSPTDVPLCGDWNGDGTDTPAVKRGNVYYFASSDRADGGGRVTSITFGRAEDRPVVGNWDARGGDTLALQRGNSFLFARANVDGGGGVDVSRYGRPGDVALSANTGGGQSTLILHRGTTFYVSYDVPGVEAMGAARAVTFGRPGDVPVAGFLIDAWSAAVGVVRVER